MIWEFPPWYHLTPLEVLAPRAERMAAMCAEQGLGGVLLTDAYDVFYASGTSQQGLVLIPAKGEPLVLMRRYAERAAAESPWPVTPISGLTQAADFLLAALPQDSRLGLTLDVMPAVDYLGWQKRLPGLKLRDATKPWLGLKAVKDAWELERMAEAGKLAASIYAALPGLIKPGRSEAELAGTMQRLAIAGGSIDHLRSRHAYHQTYSWHIASGPEGNLPSAMDAPFNGWGLSPAFPLGASHRRFSAGDPINVDFGVSLNGYQTDQTRTYVLGPAPKEVRQAHACLEEIEAALIQGLVPGAVSGELFSLSLDIAARHGLSDSFLGRPGHKIRFAAHGVGQELGCPPYILESSQAVVRQGETYALELKMLTPQGPVGLESTVAVRPSGPALNLTPAPSVLCEIPLEAS
ncbi:MAG: Xaa-Pro peptidase family protein [Desulfarculaceae bacterium]|nr:Xaa-Pro peptidase family protein [Desulfarculaceae bacterium]MCF8048578.1 Xaa-Pro peptidase family protein [Desulfarculaceae bacterium]MCF8066269.1 Xaa-Pro peptidase family protein [Desulfarculaceae bacterium]MCF8098636.1 Xaa-Pro peptidase family protein [Desulfarculaceae bacterium]MCF8124235.1 Xaa-Pro peptidase family protein [Desulfarculaceae bacterium]